MLEIDRSAFIASPDGTVAISLTSHEARADAPEEALETQLKQKGTPLTVPQSEDPAIYPTLSQIHEIFPPEPSVPVLTLFGAVPPPHIQVAREYASNHRWYDAPRDVTVSDLYAFDPAAVVSIDPFMNLIGRHFRQSKEGAVNDDTAVSHIRRTIANPDAPL